MSRLLEIDSCDDCSDSRTIYDTGYSNFCLKKKLKIKENVDIPSWCPLIKAHEFVIKKGNKSYILRKRYTDNCVPYWLNNEEGEGMEVGEDALFNLLDKYFQKEF